MRMEELINSLLYEEESTMLDFKSEQYKFVKAQDWEKAELLKDILAFSNAWRRLDAHILIGVKEIKGGKSEIIGISDDLDDAQLQQFINSKINKPINFSYSAAEIEGKKVGFITIPVQKRPVFLKKKYSKLDPNTVYVRRGSSTEIALPDEVADMGSSDYVEVKTSPKLKVFVASGEHDEIQQGGIEQSVVRAEIPKTGLFPKYGDMEEFGLPNAAWANLQGYNSEYYSEYATFYKEFISLSILKFGVENIGNLVARDVKVVMDFQGLPEGSVIFHQRELPELPKAKNRYSPLQNMRVTPCVYDLNIKTILGGYRATMSFGKIQSKDSKICSELLCIRVTDPCQISANITVYSDDLESPEKLNIPINISVKEKEYSVAELVKLADDWQSD